MCPGYPAKDICGRPIDYTAHRARRKKKTAKKQQSQQHQEEEEEEEDDEEEDWRPAKSIVFAVNVRNLHWNLLRVQHWPHRELQVCARVRVGVKVPVYL